MSTWSLESALNQTITTKRTPLQFSYSLEGLSAPERPWELQELLKTHGVPNTGIVHLGAHYGMELETYLACGFQHIIYAEANPMIYESLRKRVDFWQNWLDTFEQAYEMKKPWLEAIHCAVGEKDGPVNLHRTEYDMQSSLLSPSAEDIRQVDCVEVPGARLDSLVSQAGLQPELFSVLHMDIQGAELLALKSGMEVLKHLRVVITEVNFEARYHDCPSPQDLDHYLENLDFTRIVRTGPFPNYPVGDAIYVKKSP